MSLSADIADAIIALDQKLARYELAITRARLEVPEVEPVLASKEWEDVKERILDLMYTALGEGMHFDTLEEAFAFRDYDPAEYREIIERPAPPA